MKHALEKMISGKTLTSEETAQIFESFLSGGEDAASDEDVWAYLEASSTRLPNADELAGAARTLRKHMLKVDTSSLPKGAILVDTCGTGGSGLFSFNTSTVTAFVTAASGLFVAKHGNRSISSNCGSADVLDALAVRINYDAAQAAQALAANNFVFLFAPLFHPATKRVQGLRRELGKRTIFNFLGPLCNPAGVRRQLLGVSDMRMAPVMAETLLKLGAEHAIVVCGEDGLDEVTLSDKTQVFEARDGTVRNFVVAPEDFGLKRAPLSDFAGADPKTSAQLVRELLAGKKDARSDMVVLNAGAALFIGGRSPSWEKGIELARELLESGKPHKILDRAVVSGALG